MKRLDGRIAVIMGGGQTPGATIGNGRATSLLFGREGAKVLVADRDLATAEDTVAQITGEGGTAQAIRADVTVAADCESVIRAAVDEWGRIDVLDNNVGIGIGDSGPVHLTEDNWDRIHAVNLKGMFLACKYALPVMREQESGSIINISSIAAVCSVGLLAYKTSKAGVNALTQDLAVGNAKYGIRVNAIMPGLMDTPMAVETIAEALDVPRDLVASKRAERVPLRKAQGTAWDVANAALFFAGEESNFVTGAILPVDGGQSARIG